MIEFPIKNPSNIHRTLEDKDLRYFAKQLAYAWADYYATSKSNPEKTTLLLDWAQVDSIVASARFWNIISASLAYDISTWLKQGEFVGNVPTLIMNEYDQKYLTNEKYLDSLEDTSPMKYRYEQYFIYKELCEALGVDSNVNDEE